jgi:hypothetical protein
MKPELVVPPEARKLTKAWENVFKAHEKKTGKKVLPYATSTMRSSP